MNGRHTFEGSGIDEGAMAQRDRELANWIETHSQALTAAATTALAHARELRTVLPYSETFCDLLAEASTDPHGIYATAQFAIPLARASEVSETTRDALQALADIWEAGRLAANLHPDR
ncbi:hypothetical protein [Actinomadura rudentiformis]|uniref:Uncharacterized protein n=1 Tax=Actinomadura rudentiformis TaxID=359158 RepID=A0A6H9YSA9_9ACTN|nr:hypothetical protein [Actinomadura rudentiformis]KAB2348333.1 hypothetical protein F8566_16145 [Actinomadura rudentiformis]